MRTQTDLLLRCLRPRWAALLLLLGALEELLKRSPEFQRLWPAEAATA